MDKASFKNKVNEFVKNSPENYVPKELAMRPDLALMQIYDEPIFGYASADDPCFSELKKPGVIGNHFMSPVEWLPGAKTVISLFLPYTSRVRLSNSVNMDWPSEEWLHARIEGQSFQNALCRFAGELLEREGCPSVTPMIDSRLKSGNPLEPDKNKQESYSSNWSERHVAYVAGLGTFGLSRGLITRKGVAGRFISIITSAFFEPDKRTYTGIYDYCVMCGACVRNCPVKAISIENGKMHSPCSKFLDRTREKHAPRYGCGKCQVKVPCESKAPKTPIAP